MKKRNEVCLERNEQPKMANTRAKLNKNGDEDIYSES